MIAFVKVESEELVRRVRRLISRPHLNKKVLENIPARYSLQRNKSDFRLLAHPAVLTNWRGETMECPIKVPKTAEIWYPSFLNTEAMFSALSLAPSRDITWRQLWDKGYLPVRMLIRLGMVELQLAKTSLKTKLFFAKASR